MLAPLKKRIVIVSTYPPRACGIAQFSFDLISYIDQFFSGSLETSVVALESPLLPEITYSEKVLFRISENDTEGYREVAEKLNAMDDVAVVLIQHEFGIFGGDYGRALLNFLEHLSKPVILTLHTVLPAPDSGMKDVLQKIASAVDTLTVMTQTSFDLLVAIYGVAKEKIVIVPHGIHPHAYEDPRNAKTILGLAEKKVITTFGLLGPGKGIEYGIEALPEITKIYPDLVYLVVGATHPIVLRNEGESYREKLSALARALKIENHVIFYNEYVDIDRLLTFLRATDIYLSLGQNPNQAVSGTLTYALGTGRPVISTPFAQAKELINPSVGALVSFADSRDITHFVNDFFHDEERLKNMRRDAYFMTRDMTWENVALSYVALASTLAPELATVKKNLPKITLQHIHTLSDDFGIFQFADLTNPDPRYGYTIDDVARALIVVAEYKARGGSENTDVLTDIYVSFIERAATNDGRFNNYFTTLRELDHARNETENLDDATARALWALATVAYGPFSSPERERARTLFLSMSRELHTSESPRAVAFYIKAFGLWYEAEKNDIARNRVIVCADLLMSWYRHEPTPEWPWFENVLSYSNGLLCEGLLIAYQVTGTMEYFEVAKISLDFLISHSFQDGYCTPIGQKGWFKKGEEKQLFDQQPEEVSALVLALARMWQISGDEMYREKMFSAFEWYLGSNSIGKTMYTAVTGGCYDGFSETHINLNQGAESTISYLLARLAIERI